MVNEKQSIVCFERISALCEFLKFRGRSFVINSFYNFYCIRKTRQILLVGLIIARYIFVSFFIIEFYELLIKNNNKFTSKLQKSQFS